MKSSEQHKAEAPKTLSFAIIVTSSKLLEGKYPQDLSGDIAESLIRGKGHTIVLRVVVPNDVKAIRAAVKKAISEHRADIVLVTGGTGISPRDVSIEAVTPLLEKTLPGFGELFRFLTFQREGSIAVVTRATAGIYKGSAIFVTPGSPSAVQLALEQLILPEAPHIVKHAREG